MNTKLFFLLSWVAALGMSSAEAMTYSVNETGLQSQNCLPNCSSFGALVGTITTDGTFGVGLGPSIITGWNFTLNDGVNPPVILTTANSFITSNFSNLLIATPSELDFNFSANAGFQPLMEFTSSTDGAVLAEFFSSTGPSVGGVGIWTGGTGHPDVGLEVSYLTGTQLIATAEAPLAETPLPAALPLFATGLGALGLFGWRRKRPRPRPLDNLRGALMGRKNCFAKSVCRRLLHSILVTATVTITIPCASAATYVLENVTGNLGDTLTGQFDYTVSSGFANIDVELNGCGDPRICGDVFTTFIPANPFSPNQFNFEAANGDILQINLLDALTLAALTGLPGDFHTLYGGILFPLGATAESIGGSWVGGAGAIFALSPAPLPATLPLFATGLGALGLLGWRRKRKAQVAA